MRATSKRKRGGADHDAEAAVQDRTREKPKDTAKKPEKRTSKHAPVEMTSKKQVSRRRDFLSATAETKKAASRDPRFMPLGAAAGSGGSGSSSKIDEIKARKAYAFLDDYRASEMQELRAAIKKTRNEGEKEKLQKALLSMESRKKAQDRKDKERAVIEEHRRREKELVRQGKTPFYLKKSEQKKRLLVDQFQGMKKKEADRAIERRRKKMAGKEKKLLPMARRGAEDR
jgi:ribosomal RNA-processing protein 36